MGKFSAPPPPPPVGDPAPKPGKEDGQEEVSAQAQKDKAAQEQRAKDGRDKAAAAEASREAEEKSASAARVRAEREKATAEKARGAKEAEEQRRKKEEQHRAQEEANRKVEAESVRKAAQERAQEEASRKAEEKRAAEQERLAAEKRAEQERAAKANAAERAKQAEAAAAAAAAAEEEARRPKYGPGISPPTFRFYTEPDDEKADDEAGQPRSELKQDLQQADPPVPAYLRQWTSVYDSSDVMNPGGLGKTVDVSLIYTPRRQGLTAKRDDELHASYVDKIVHALDKDVRTGTGVARKTPVQLKNNLWAPGYTTKSASNLGANEKFDMIKIYGKKDPITDFHVQHRMTGQASGLGIDEQLAREFGDNYETFDEAHKRCYTPRSDFVKPYMTRVELGPETISYRVIGEQWLPLGDEKQTKSDPEIPPGIAVSGGSRGYRIGGYATGPSPFLSVHGNAARTGTGNAARLDSGNVLSPEQVSSSKYRNYTNVSSVLTPMTPQAGPSVTSAHSSPPSGDALPPGELDVQLNKVRAR